MIAWVTATVDVPRRRVRTAVDFWGAVTETRLSPWRGEADELATFLPRSGDPHLRLQALADETDRPGVHVGLHTAEVDVLAARALELGAAETTRQPGHVVLRTPGGFGLCVLAHEGEATLPVPVAGERADQVCLDVPVARWDAEVAFWSALTDWPLHQVSRREDLTLLQAPAQQSLTLLLQRRDGDVDGPVEGHLDIAVGDSQDRLEQATARHTSLGADFVEEHPWWHVMRAPDGSTYCLTRRDPVTGR